MNLELQTKLKALGVTRVIVADFETYYSQEYSLTTMPMQQYILDHRFEVIGVGISTDFDFPRWYIGGGALLALSALKLDTPGTLFVAHNAFFDAGILAFQLGIHPWMMLCTMMGSRPRLITQTMRGSMALSNLAKLTNVGDKKGYVVRAKGKRLSDFDSRELGDYGDYCIRDTEITVELAKMLLQELPEDELWKIHYTIRKFTRPKAKLDTRVLTNYLKELRDDKRRLLLEAGIDDPGVLQSNEKFAELLKRNGLKNPPKKISPATGKETWAFAKNDFEFKALAEHDSEAIQALHAARIGHKSTQAETRAERFLQLSYASDRIAIPTLYYGAHTGRSSGYDKLNMQNLPRGGNLRRAVTAPPGHVIVSGDLSQIEVRIGAVIANDAVMLRAFKEGKDPYKVFATYLYGVNYQSVTKEQRRIAKSAVLGLQYGMGPIKFDEYLSANGVTDLTMKEIKRIVYRYREVYEDISNIWATAAIWLGIIMGQGMTRFARHGPLLIAKEFIGLPNGMAIRYTDIRNEASTNETLYGPQLNRKRIYAPKVFENVVQALANIVITRAELNLAKRGVESILSVHDELLYVVRADIAMKLVRALEYVLTRPVSWMGDMPIDCEIKIGANYADATGDRSKWPTILSMSQT